MTLSADPELAPLSLWGDARGILKQGAEQKKLDADVAEKATAPKVSKSNRNVLASSLAFRIVLVSVLELLRPVRPTLSQS